MILLLIILRCPTGPGFLFKSKENMVYIDRKKLIEKKIINDWFDYQGLDMSIIQLYQYYDNTFTNWFKGYADAYGIKNCCFYIQDNDKCNAFAQRKNGYNIIGITNGYCILMHNKLSSEYFKNIVLAGLLNEPDISEAYCDLIYVDHFDLIKFIQNCSSMFIFRHEFQHLLQMNYETNYFDESMINEIFKISKFELKKHIWEFDADRISSFEILKYVFRVYSKYAFKNERKLICLLYISIASMLITLSIFYFGIADQTQKPYFINQIPFYTEMYSHPHPLVRCTNIMEYMYGCIVEDFPALAVNPQSILNNSMGIMNLYFNEIVSEKSIMNVFLDEMKKHINEINDYLQKLYDWAVKDEAIKRTLLKRGISFD